MKQTNFSTLCRLTWSRGAHLLAKAVADYDACNYTIVQYCSLMPLFSMSYRSLVF
jgi:hypothetical protein